MAVMAAEKTLVTPLSGDEVIEAILHTIRQALNRDCFLAPHMGYASFSFDARVDICFQNTQTSIKGTFAEVKGEGGEVTDDPVSEVSVVANAAPAPPNVVRKETGQGVPILTRDKTGRVEQRKAKYAKPNKNRNIPGKTFD